MDVILSDDCWMKGTRCGKSTFPDCPCLKDNVECRTLTKIAYLFNQTLLTKKQWEKVTIYNSGEHFDELRNYAKHIKQNVENGTNLYIYSNTCGNGKTTWAIRMIQEYIYSIWGPCDLSCHALFVNVPRYLLALKDSISCQNDYADHIKHNVLNADLVVWDDIATKAATDYERENLLSIIDTRINLGKANIYTSNSNQKELYKQVGDRLASRIYNGSINVEVKDVDRRGYAK